MKAKAGAGARATVRGTADARARAGVRGYGGGQGATAGGRGWHGGGTLLERTRSLHAMPTLTSRWRHVRKYSVGSVVARVVVPDAAWCMGSSVVRGGKRGAWGQA